MATVRKAPVKSVVTSAKKPDAPKANRVLNTVSLNAIKLRQLCFLVNRVLMALHSNWNVQDYSEKAMFALATLPESDPRLQDIHKKAMKVYERLCIAMKVIPDLHSYRRVNQLSSNIRNARELRGNLLTALNAVESSAEYKALGKALASVEYGKIYNLNTGKSYGFTAFTREVSSFVRNSQWDVVLVDLGAPRSMELFLHQEFGSRSGREALKLDLREKFFFEILRLDSKIAAVTLPKSFTAVIQLSSAVVLELPDVKPLVTAEVKKAGGVPTFSAIIKELEEPISAEIGKLDSAVTARIGQLKKKLADRTAALQQKARETEKAQLQAQLKQMPPELLAAIKKDPTILNSI